MTLKFVMTLGLSMVAEYKWYPGSVTQFVGYMKARFILIALVTPSA